MCPPRGVDRSVARTGSPPLTQLKQLPKPPGPPPSSGGHAARARRPDHLAPPLPPPPSLLHEDPKPGSQAAAAQAFVQARMSKSNHGRFVFGLHGWSWEQDEALYTLYPRRARAHALAAYSRACRAHAHAVVA